MDHLITLLHLKNIIVKKFFFFSWKSTYLKKKKISSTTNFIFQIESIDFLYLLWKIEQYLKRTSSHFKLYFNSQRERGWFFSRKIRTSFPQKSQSILINFLKLPLVFYNPVINFLCYLKKLYSATPSASSKKLFDQKLLSLLSKLKFNLIFCVQKFKTC